MKYTKPKIIISKCLEFDACRYDGQIINNQYIKKLKKHIEFITVCPEVEIGMGTPRLPIKIIESSKGKQLFQPGTGKNYLRKMKKFSNEFLNEKNVDGFILKSKSPSCGINTAKVYPNKKNCAPIKKSHGIFTESIINKFPYHPIEEEKRLNNDFIREHFYTSIFTIADFRKVNDFNNLYKYHAKHKYLFMAYNQIIMREMGKIAANENNYEIELVIKKYYEKLLLLFLKKARVPSNINTQMHVMGYFKKFLSPKEKEHFLNALELYRNKKIAVSSINSILYSWVVRFENDYLLKQSFFNPFPSDLIESEKSRFI